MSYFLGESTRRVYNFLMATDTAALQFASLVASAADNAVEVSALTSRRDDLERQACKARRCEDHAECSRLFALADALTEELTHEHGVDPEDG